MSISYRNVILPYAKHSDEITIRQKKEIAYPAVDGVSVMHFGKRTKTFLIQGLITDMITGAFKKSTIEGWSDTGTGILNIHGSLYTNVQIKNCRFGAAYKNAVSSTIACEFMLELEKLQ